MDELKLWEQMPGEPTFWYQRFQKYLLAGPGRSMKSVYIAWRTEEIKKGRSKPMKGAVLLPKAWTEAISKWQWKARADAFDRHEVARRQQDYEEERLRDREIRRQILGAARVKLVEALNLLDPGTANWANVSAWIKMLNEEQRIELDDQPAQRQEISDSGGKLVVEVVYQKKDNPYQKKE
jgi:hypothetical protein